MMADFTKWIGKYKQLCILTGVFGLLLSPFLWPFFLAIVFNSLTLLVPALLIWALYKQPWKEKKANEESGHFKKDDAKGAGAMDSDDGNGGKNTPKTGHQAQKGQGKGEEPLRKEATASPYQSGKEGALKAEGKPENEAVAFARSWYQMQGRETILRFKVKLDRERITSFSIARDGICTVKEGDRYRRIGVLRNFPKQEMEVVSAQLKREGFRTSLTKDHRYLWISWKEVQG